MAAASGSARSSPARSPSGSDDEDREARSSVSRRCCCAPGDPRHRAQAVDVAGGGVRARSAAASTCRIAVEHRRSGAPTSAASAWRRAHDPPDRRRSVVYLDPAPRAAFDTRRRAARPHGSAQRDVRAARAGDRRRARRSTSRTTTRPTTTSSRSRRPSRSTSAGTPPGGPSRSASTNPASSASSARSIRT